MGIDKYKRGNCSKRVADASPFTSRDDEYYSMSHAERGLAVIFNQEHFSNPSYNRVGSQFDRNRLEVTFNRLGFETLIFNNLTANAIVNQISNLSKRDYSNSDCFAMVFMSHGSEGKVLAYDQPININTLWDPFIGDSCPSLVNKPKLFFIQACQGSKRQGAVNVEVNTKSSEDYELEKKRSGEFVPSFKIPNRADFLVALSTIPGYVSWRSRDSGTFFLQSLCDNLDKHGFDLDIHTLLTRVNRRVAIDFENCSSPSETGTCSKQLPTMISMLIRLLKFSNKDQQKNSHGQSPKKKTKINPATE